VGDPAYGNTIQAALTAIGSTSVTLRVPAGTYVISTDTNIPANVTLKPERGAIIQIATTKTLTINGGLEAGLYQIFSCTGTGKVVFGAGSVDAILPKWGNATGNGSAAMQWAFDTAAGSTCKKIRLTDNVYTFNTPIDVTAGADIDHSGIVVEGLGRKAGTTIYANTGGILFELTGSAWTSWRGFSIEPGLTNPSTVGFFMTGTTTKPNCLYHDFSQIINNLYKGDITGLTYGTIGYLVIGSEENTWDKTQTYATTPFMFITDYVLTSAEYPSYFRAAEITAAHSCGVNTFSGENSLVTYDKKGSNIVFYGANTIDLGNMYCGNIVIGAPGAINTIIQILGGTLMGCRGKIMAEAKATLLDILSGEIMAWDLTNTLSTGLSNSIPLIDFHTDSASIIKFQDINLHFVYQDPTDATFIGKKIFDTTGNHNLVPKIDNVNVTLNQDYSNFGVAPFPAWFCGIARSLKIKWNDVTYSLEGSRHTLLGTSRIYLGFANTVTPTDVAKIYLPPVIPDFSARSIVLRAQGLLTAVNSGAGGSEANLTQCMFDTSRGAYSLKDGVLVIGTKGTGSDDLIANSAVTAISNNAASFLYTGVNLNMVYDTGTRTIQANVLPVASGTGLATITAFIYDLRLEMFTTGRLQELIYLQ
jgi:hypothetical protein